MSGLPLFDCQQEPPVIRPTDPHGETVRGDVDEKLVLRSRYAWDMARIELHLDRESGLWMWSASHHANGHGCGYRVGAKWGNFAVSRDNALYHAVNELLKRLGDCDTPDVRRIRAWAEGLT